MYPYERWSDKDIPAFVQGETLKPKALAMEAGATTAPELLTERDLITLMDRHGIGTDATIASHIQKILERNYVTKQGQHFAPTRLGLTLVNGFDRMGFEFSQPTLRAQTERDMAAIAAGEISKQEALARNVETYRRLYALQQQQVAVLDAEFAKNFQPRPVRFSRRTPGFSTCGKCGGLMDLVADGDAQSLLCPACDEIYLLEPRFPVVVTALPHTCPVCAFQAVEVRGSFGVTVCPACKRNPPPQFFAPDARTDCRDCTNAACALAKGAAGRPVRLCPACRRHSLVLRANKKTGAPFLSCSQYPACSGLVNLPPCAAAALSPERCEACSAKFGVSIQKLQFSFAGPGQAMGGPLAAAHCIAGCSPQYMNPMLAQANPNVRDLFSAGGNANGGSNASNSGNNSRAAAAAAPAAPAASLAGSYQRMKSGFAAKENGGVRCGGCGGAAVELTVKKDNENKVRASVMCANVESRIVCFCSSSHLGHLGPSVCQVCGIPRLRLLQVHGRGGARPRRRRRRRRRRAGHLLHVPTARPLFLGLSQPRRRRCRRQRGRGQTRSRHRRRQEASPRQKINLYSFTRPLTALYWSKHLTRFFFQWRRMSSR